MAISTNGYSRNVLPDSLITYQRKAGARGQYSYRKFATRKAEVTDEIALDPKHFLDRSDSEVLSTLVHEMVHQWQAHFGKPSRGGYHNKEWGRQDGEHRSDAIDHR